MSSTNLIRWSGLAVILAGVLLPMPWILEFVVGSPRSILTQTLEFVALILLVFGLMGIYGIQIEESGIYGFLGFLLIIISNCVLLGQTWLPESGQLVGVAGVLGPLGGITGLPGFILLGIGSWKANKLQRWTAVLWPIGMALHTIAMVLTVSGFVFGETLAVIGVVVQGIGLVGAGVNLWSGKGEPTRQPEAAT